MKQDNIARAVINEIQRHWTVDADHSVSVEDAEAWGFDWWPGDFKVEVRVAGPQLAPDATWRLSVRTAFLREVDVSKPDFSEKLASLNSLAPSFALCSSNPPDGRIFLQSTAYLHHGVAEWLPRFFAAQTILQPVQSQFRVATAAEILGGKPDQSRQGEPDEILNVEALLYVPAGLAESRWAGTGEFEQIAEKWGRQDFGFGMGGETGLSFETPFGDSSAIIQLFTDQPHPILGHGLLAILQFPFVLHNPSITADLLNGEEARSWVTAPLMGNWSTSYENDELVYSMFIPNLLYQRGLAENVVLQSATRVRWLRERLFPNLEDLTMIEILERRHKFASNLHNIS